MTERYTAAARERLEAYLAGVRTALRAAPAVDAEDVEQGVREHVDAELRDVEPPVPLADLEGVLDRLGRPEDWVPEEEVSAWRQALLRLQTGPEDWRLAYLTLGLLVVGLAIPPAAPAFLLASFLMARAACTLVRERGERLGARRWLVYPSLLFVYLVVALPLVAWPVFAIPGLFATGGPARTLQDYVAFSLPSTKTGAYVLLLASWGALFQGVWWTLAGGVSAARPTWVRALFRPFADGFRRRHGRALAVAGAFLAAAGALALVVQ